MSYINGKSHCVAKTVEGQYDKPEIAQLFADKYCELYNSVSYSNTDIYIYS